MVAWFGQIVEEDIKSQRGVFNLVMLLNWNSPRFFYVGKVKVPSEKDEFNMDFFF